MTGLINGTAYTFAVTATNSAGAGPASSPSNQVTVGSLSFSDDPLTTGTTAVKAVHLTELRQAIAELRTRSGLGAFAWTDATIVPGVTPVKAAHLTELRTALNAVYTLAGHPVPTYTHATITGGVTAITAVDIAELRAAVLAIW